MPLRLDSHWCSARPWPLQGACPRCPQLSERGQSPAGGSSWCGRGCGSAPRTQLHGFIFIVALCEKQKLQDLRGRFLQLSRRGTPPTPSALPLPRACRQTSRPRARCASVDRMRSARGTLVTWGQDVVWDFIHQVSSFNEAHTTHTHTYTRVHTHIHARAQTHTQTPRSHFKMELFTAGN